jgi:toxin secretion/phage lysis holin
MDRVDLTVKSIAAIIVGIFSIFVDLFGVVFTILLILIAVDFVTGIMGAIVSGVGLRSSIGIKGLIKKTYIILLIGAIYGIEIAILKTNGIITNSISAAYCVTELISIVENGGKMNAPIPTKVKNLITTLKNKIESSDDTSAQK